MDKLKRYLIKGISFLMVVIILVATPLSDYADTQGIGRSHAASVIPYVAGGALITLIGLSLGVVINESQADSMYNEYYGYSVANNETEAVTVLDKIKEGAIEILLIPALFNSFASFLENAKRLDLDSGFQSQTYVSGSRHHRPSAMAQNAYVQSLIDYLPTYNENLWNNAVCIESVGNNKFYVYYITNLNTWTSPIISIYEYFSSYYGSYTLNAVGFSSEGLAGIYDSSPSYNYTKYMGFQYKDTGWSYFGGGSKYTTSQSQGGIFNSDEFYTLKPIYKTNFTAPFTSGTLSDFTSGVVSDTVTSTVIAK